MNSYGKAENGLEQQRNGKELYRIDQQRREGFMTNYEKLRREGESIDDVIKRILHEEKVCGRFCDMKINSYECLKVRCSDRIRIFLESEAR